MAANVTWRLPPSTGMTAFFEPEHEKFPLGSMLQPAPSPLKAAQGNPVEPVSSLKPKSE
jgi:hypothetical protein